MARPRAKVSENDYKVPDWYREDHEVTDGFEKAFNRAMQKGSSEKASLLYAEAHGSEEDAEE